MKKQRILSALLTLCLVFSLVPTALAAGADGFTDVSKDSWCYDYVDYVTSEGYFLGTTDTTFSPDRNMTRAMFVVVLSRFDGVDVNNGQSSFADVEAGAWCAGAVEWAAENGIVTGYADGTFKPNASITRAQMCAIMDRYVDYYTAKHDIVVTQEGTSSTLTDQNQVPAYAAEAVRNCQKYGLINGYEDGSFRPQAYSTRAHVAAIIYRLAFLLDDTTTTEKITMVVGDETYTETVTVNRDGDFKVPAKPSQKAPSGKTFLGWKNSEDGKTYRPGASCKFVKGMRLTAVYGSGGNGGYVPQDTDLIGNAVKASMDQAERRYEAAKEAVKDAVKAVNGNDQYFTQAQLAQIENAINNMLNIGKVTYSSVTDSGDPNVRPQTITASVAVTDDIAATIITKATALALEVVDADPTADDVDALLQAVKDAVKAETGIVISDKSYEEIKAQVIEVVMTEGKSLWKNFQDGNGGFVCGDVTVKVGEDTVAVVGVDKTKTNPTSLKEGGSKTDVVKKIAEKVAKQMFQDLKDASKENGNGYVSNVTVFGTVTLEFQDSVEYWDKTVGYPHIYPVTLQLTMNSDEQVLYKYAGGENYLKIRITDKVATAYNDALNQAAAQITQADPETKNRVVSEIQNMLTAEGENSLWTTIQSAVVNYGITLDESAKEDMIAALTGKEETEKSVVEQWVDTNWTQIVASASSGKVENTDNSALINALVPVMEKNIPTGNELDDTIQGLIDQQLSAMEKEDPNWILNTYNGNNMVKMAKQLVESGVATVTPEVNFNVTSIEEIDDLVKAGRITIQTPYLETDAIVNIQTVVEMEAGQKLAAEMENSDTLKTCLSDEHTKQYAIYSALVQAGLTSFEKKKDEARYNDQGEDIMVTLRESVVEVAKGKIPNIINSKIEDVNVTEILKNTDELQSEYQEKIDLFNSLKLPAVRDQQLSNLAEKLTSDTMKEVIGDRGNTMVERYLNRVINWIPAGADVIFDLGTEGEVSINKAELQNAFGAADSTVEAMEALAEILEQFGDLCINDLAESKGGIPVEVHYNTRTFAFILVVE